jgi:hemerythrin-like domain-containing protein
MTDRRLFLTAVPLGLAGTLPGLASARADDKKDDKKKDEEEIGATEDLMREHGVLNRVLLVYEEGLRRIHAKEDVPPEVFRATASLVRKFVEDYHEKLEENFLFPAFEKKNTLTDLVKVLKKQHDAGRKLTDTILREAADDRFTKADGRKALVAACEAFIRMYRPHEAREDTVLFPAFRKVVGKNEYDALGEDFEKKEHQLFGDDGFEKMVDRVAGIEKALGIYDLAQFTPNV